MKKLVIGILAHVDSGKTTLSEGMLYCCGEIRKLGRVDHKNAFLDTNNIERERGITIFSKQALLHYNNTEFTLLDTPGHVDFSTETERTLQVLDYAVLVISAPSGVQSHTQTLWQLLKRYNVPTFIFINKMDITHSTAYDVMCQLRKCLSDGCVDFSKGTAESDAAENIAMQDEALMEQYIGKGAFDAASVAAAISARKLFPCFFGSALKLDGIEKLLSSLDEYTQMKKMTAAFSARVFKIAQDEHNTRLTYMKITGGSLRVRDSVHTVKNGIDLCEKISQLRIYSGEKYKTADEVLPGTVCAAAGLSQTYPGEGLGATADSMLPLLEPVVTYSVIFPTGTDDTAALSMLRTVEEEDPALHVSWNKQTRKIQVQLMGEIQLEVMKRILLERFNTSVEFHRGSIAYKETIASSVEGAGHFEPLRHYAEVHLLLEPGARGSGIRLAADVSDEVLALNWQRLVLTHLAERAHRGVLTGSPITDVLITLVAGRAHQKHTEGGDFRQATYRALRQGLRKAESVLLEPWYDFTLTVPSEVIGRAMNDLQQMGAEFSAPQHDGESAVISGGAPVSEMWDYRTHMAGYTSGKGQLVCILRGYDKCHNAAEVTAAFAYDCDADVENTADSVFCANGAGFNVKWNQADEYMHVSSGISFGETEKEDKTEEVRRVSEYVGSIEQDRELLAIFEKTYGPVRRREHSALHTQKEVGKPYKGKPMPMGEKYLLVDGYNIIFAWDELKKLAEKELELARSRLTTLLCNYAAIKKHRVILVFDAYKVKNNPGAVERVHNIDVVYTREAETADMYIERVTHELGKSHRVRVATSDGLEQLIILAGGAVRVTADEFQQEIKETEAIIRKFIKE